MAPILKCAVLSLALVAGFTDTAFGTEMKVEQVKEEVQAIECGKMVIMSYHGKLMQAPPPKSSNPESCEKIQFTLKDVEEVHKDAFKDLVNLESVMLYGNKIRELHPDTFKDTRKLKQLMLSGNHFKTLPANLFRNLQKLTFLDIYALMQMEDLPVNLLEPLMSLEKLYAGDLRLTNDFLEKGFLDPVADTLQHLSLGHNKLTAMPRGVFEKMSSLTTVSVAQNQITKITKKDLKALKNLENLHTIVLSSNPLKCCDRIDGLPEPLEKALDEVCPEKKCAKEKKPEEKVEESKEEEKKEEEEKAEEPKEAEEEEKKEEEKAEEKEERDEL